MMPIRFETSPEAFSLSFLDKITIDFNDFPWIQIRRHGLSAETIPNVVFLGNVD